MTTLQEAPLVKTLAPLEPRPLVERLVLSFRKEVRVEHSEGRSKLRTPFTVQALRSPDGGLRAVLDRLCGEGGTADELADLVQDNRGDLAHFYYRLGQWKSWHLVRYTLVAAGAPLLTLEPMGQAGSPTLLPVVPDTVLTLSRFAFCRAFDGALVLESPLAHARAILHPGAVPLLAALARPQPAGALASLLRVAVDEVCDLLGLLAGQRLVTVVGDDGVSAESGDETLQQWNFHDLLFHTRSRTGRHDYAFGATYKFLNRIEPQPAVKPPMAQQVVPLARADVAQLKRQDLPFSYVLEARRSVREYGDPPISLAQLGAFLYRVARVRELFPRDSRPGRFYEASSRPYPAGGAGYELELYLTVNTCAGLESGLYHYDPLHHRLERLSGRTPHVERLLDDASVTAARLCVPQVLITYASRFQRMGWKYDGLAYAATLKNVGALYQTMYLVATAMNLAPCALGSGNSDLLALAAGLDYLQESSVGEFMLGSHKQP